MRFDCGKTREQKWTERKFKVESWNPWFAWHPVRIGPRKCVWLEKIERRYKTYGLSFSSMWAVEYRDLTTM